MRHQDIFMFIDPRRNLPKPRAPDPSSAQASCHGHCMPWQKASHKFIGFAVSSGSRRSRCTLSHAFLDGSITKRESAHGPSGLPPFPSFHTYTLPASSRRPQDGQPFGICLQAHRGIGCLSSMHHNSGARRGRRSGAETLLDTLRAVKEGS